VNRILWPLAAGFRLGVALRQLAYRRGWFKTRRLGCPVVSVGNLTVGGTGKTPCVAWIAQRLLKGGWKPGILTRGYGRRSGAELVALAPGSQRAVDARLIGDEPAVLARKLPGVPIVVCADRYRGGRLTEDGFGVDVHVLDDGFQHLALARNIDVVLLDVTQDFSMDALLPAGRLREPYSALKRAHLVVLTRVDLGDPAPLEQLVGKINPQAKVFRSTMRLAKLVDIASGSELSTESVRGKVITAFCGIGNPKAFFADLRKWGFLLGAETAFPDHHVYSAAELEGLARRARQEAAGAMFTTEKDALNLPPRWESEIPVCACAIEIEMSEAEVFEEALLGRLQSARITV